MCSFRCLLKRHVFSIAIIVKISLNENENLFVLAMHKWWKSLSIYQHRHDVRGQLILLSICLMEISSIKHGSLHLFACFKHRKDVLSLSLSLSLSLLIISVLGFLSTFTSMVNYFVQPLFHFNGSTRRHLLIHHKLHSSCIIIYSCGIGSTEKYLVFVCK